MMKNNKLYNKAGAIIQQNPRLRLVRVNYTGDDTEAIELVHDYFGKDAKFNRRF